jgi:hypothetical protein
MLQTEIVFDGAIGPKRTLTTSSRCCGAARRTSHSCIAQHFVGLIVGVRRKRTVQNCKPMPLGDSSH